jgi:CRISPR-associated exonuclease Cas4
MIIMNSIVKTTKITSSPSYTGVQINYYFVCKRKHWFFSHDLNMEHSSDLVLLGKLVHESRYK